MNNYHTIYQNLPAKIKGYVAYNPTEDYYTIVLNSQHSYYQNIETYKHELSHIRHDDIHSLSGVDALETIRHNTKYTTCL